MKGMQRLVWSTVMTGLILLCLGPSVAAVEAKPAAPKVEVVFCLDTTGSMRGLIEGAKQKIWSICNQIAGGKPAPDLKIGLVAYRDKGDAYVTKVFDLTDDLDAIHGHLGTFQAQGGGDNPESVNQALFEAVNKIKWSTDDKTLRIIFLVGDAPPHMDYDEVKYPEICVQACKKGIIINTIQCGNQASATEHWQQIAQKAEGSYAKIAQSGGVVTVRTPFDDELSKLNSELAKTTVVYGDRELRQRNLERKEVATGFGKASADAPAAADRVAALAKMRGGRVAAYDLIDNIREGKVKLADLKDDQLPEEMRKMTLKEREEYLKKLAEKREEIRAKVLELDKKRREFIAKKLEETKGKDGFDQQVLEMLRKQAKKHKIDY
ncbi:MAG: hypothetical protein KatS3mg105_3803 [Gemmatales bacterium]|nr:MAG: hypothetical protein KatS3mg105_3803 [Gemmatales bacterium]